MRLKAIILASIAALAVVACEPTNDTPIRTQPKETAHDGLPPRRFQGDVDVGVRFVANPAAACHEAGAQFLGGELSACTVKTTYRNKTTNETFSEYVMIVKNPCLTVTSRRNPMWDYCHEIGHVNAWPETHTA